MMTNSSGTLWLVKPFTFQLLTAVHKKANKTHIPTKIYSHLKPRTILFFWLANVCSHILLKIKVENGKDVIFSFLFPVKFNRKSAADVSSNHTHSAELYATVMHCVALA